MTGLAASSDFEVGDIVAVEWMGETVFATIEKLDKYRPTRSYWLAIPGVRYLAAYRKEELKDPASCA